MTKREAKRNTKQEATTTYMLLAPLQPSYFGYSDDEVSRMVNELNLVGISTVLVETNTEMIFFARAPRITLLEDLCTCYNIKGLCVQVNALYDQVTQPEMVPVEI